MNFSLQYSLAFLWQETGTTYFPNSFSRGFASRVMSRGSKRDAVFVWVYRNGQPAFECSTSNVAVETHFYGKEGDLNVDDEITTLEGDFASSLKALRTQGDGYEISDDRVIQFITHLTSRTKHLRDTIIDSFGFLADSVFGYFSDYDNWKVWCIEHLKRHPEVMKKSLDEALAKLPVSAHKKAMARHKIKRMPVERIMGGMDKDESYYTFLFAGLRLKLAEGLEDMVKQGHIKALLKNLVSDPRVEHYQKLRWYVRRSNEPLILGDVGCLFELRGECRFKSLGGVEDEIQNVFLPISSDCMIVGTVAGVPEVDFVAINEAVAKCSRDFFVSSTSSPNMVRLASMLGQESDMMTKDEMETVISELINEP